MGGGLATLVIVARTVCLSVLRVCSNKHYLHSNWHLTTPACCWRAQNVQRFLGFVPPKGSQNLFAPPR
jgi:hypothetical protein